MLVSLFTGLTAASIALAGPVVHQPRGFKSGEMGGTESGGHKGAGSAGDWLQVTSVEYSGNGCPEGTLTGQFCPESTSFNVTISDLKAELEDNKPDDVAYCYVKIGLRTSASKQVNVLRGEFSGHVKLESEGMTAYEKNTYSFSKNKGEHEMRWDFKGPTDLDTVFTNDIKTTFLSPCGGDFELILDNILELRRGDKAKQDDNGYIEISKLTGNLGHALVLEEKDCEKSDDEDSGKDDSGSDDYGKSSSYGKGGDDGKGSDDGKDDDDDDDDDDKDDESEPSYSSNGNGGNNDHYRE